MITNTRAGWHYSWTFPLRDVKLKVGVLITVKEFITV